MIHCDEIRIKYTTKRLMRDVFPTWADPTSTTLVTLKQHKETLRYFEFCIGYTWPPRHANATHSQHGNFITESACVRVALT